MELGADWLKRLEQTHLSVNVWEGWGGGERKGMARGCAESHVMEKVWSKGTVGGGFRLEKLVWKKRWFSK